MLSSENRLRKRKEFGYIYKKGKVVHSPYLNIIYVDNNRKNFKMGFSISKKIGKAVVRNKTKRRLSAIIRENLNLIKNEYNYVVVAKPDIDKLTYAQLKENFEKALKKGNFLK